MITILPESDGDLLALQTNGKELCPNLVFEHLS